MARDISILMTNYRATGSNVSVPQYALDVTVNWTKDDGTPGTHSETVLFPNILAQVPVGKRDELVKEIILAMLKIKAGVE